MFLGAVPLAREGQKSEISQIRDLVDSGADGCESS
jgi:hypothetical protein